MRSPPSMTIFVVYKIAVDAKQRRKYGLLGRRARHGVALHARTVSSQSMSPHAEMMAINYQQNMSMEVYLEIVGPDQAAQA